jgi:hypothetical protein
MPRSSSPCSKRGCVAGDACVMTFIVVCNSRYHQLY